MADESQRIPPSLVTPVRNLKWTYQREDEGEWSIWERDGGFVAEMVCSEEIVRKFVTSGTPDSTTTGWNVLDNDGISVRFDEYGRLQIALNSPKGFVYQVTSWRPRTAEMLSDWLSEQDWEAIRKRALEVDARAFDGPEPILNPPTVAHSPLPWVFTYFTKQDGSDIETVQDIADTAAATALRATGTTLWGVASDEKDAEGRTLVVCYTGNGPHSEANARLIVAAINALNITQPAKEVPDGR